MASIHLREVRRSLFDFQKFLKFHFDDIDKLFRHPFLFDKQDDPQLQKGYNTQILWNLLDSWGTTISLLWQLRELQETFPALREAVGGDDLQRRLENSRFHIGSVASRIPGLGETYQKWIQRFREQDASFSTSRGFHANSALQLDNLITLCLQYFSAPGVQNFIPAY